MPPSTVQTSEIFSSLTTSAPRFYELFWNHLNQFNENISKEQEIKIETCIQLPNIGMVDDELHQVVKKQEKNPLLHVRDQSSGHLPMNEGVFGKHTPYSEQNFPAMTTLKVFYSNNWRLLQEHFSVWWNTSCVLELNSKHLGWWQKPNFPHISTCMVLFF